MSSSTSNSTSTEGPVPAATLARWNRFRSNRNAALAEEHGWLTLTSFQWLPDSPAPAALVPGRWWTDGEAGYMLAEPADGFTFAGTSTPATGTLSATLANEESLMWVRHGSIVVELAVRGGRYLIRTRDSQSPVLTGFAGVPVYAFNPALVLTARFEPYEKPRTTTIGTSHPDVASSVELVGDVVFELDGRSHRLAAEEGALGSRIVTFHDATNGRTTAGWRKVELTRPRPDGTLVVDFNRAINYPSAFTDFGTCPRPVDGNSLSVEVQAGEQKVR